MQGNMVGKVKEDGNYQGLGEVMAKDMETIMLLGV